MSDGRIAAVILAAGASRRLGYPKQLIQLGGESLLRRTARLAVEARCTPVFVVLGFEAERICPELDGLPVYKLLNPDWTEGMGSSLRCGVEAAQVAGSDGVLLLVCDQPRLSGEHLRALLTRYARGAIAASAYDGQLGVPAVFAAGYYPELLELQGDRGARQVIENHTDVVQSVAWPEGAVDIDSAEHLREITPE